MNKKDFEKLINDNKEIFICLQLINTTLRYDHPHTSLVVYWKGGMGKNSVIKTMRGYPTDLKNIEVLNKYKKWINQ